MNLLRRVLGALAVLVAVSTALVGLSAGSAYAMPCNGPLARPCHSTDDFICWEFPPYVCKVPIVWYEPVSDRGYVKFFTVDGTAVAPRDYEEIRDGVLELPAGTAEIDIPLWLTPTDRPGPDKEFYLYVHVEADRYVADLRIRIVIVSEAAR
jgi:hypothetical protein